jgi:hypothetical protein
MIRSKLILLAFFVMGSSMVWASSPTAELKSLNFESTNILDVHWLEASLQNNDDVLEPKSSNPPARFMLVTASALTGKDYGNYVLNQGYNLVVGWRWNKGFRVGLGSGLEKYDEYVLPFFGFAAIPLGGNLHSSFLYAKAGYGVAFASSQGEWWNSSGILGGLLLGGGASTTLFYWNRIALRGGLGYRFQKIVGEIESPWQGKRIVEYGRIDLHLMLSFW